jgi:hypothetical protein
MAAACSTSGATTRPIFRCTTTGASHRASFRGHAAPVLDSAAHYRSVSLLHGAFGPEPGNLELVARRDDDKVMHFWREGILQWQGPFHVL